MSRFFSFVSRLVPGTVAHSADVNNIIDGLSAGLDAVQGELNRALKLPVADVLVDHAFAESSVARASKLLQFDSAGNPIASNTIGADVDMATKKIIGLGFATGGSSPVTLDQLNAFSGSLAGLPSILGQSGKYISTDGTTVFWTTIPAIPAQSGGTANQFLMSNGVSATWTNVPNLVPSSVNAGVPLTHDGTAFTFNIPNDNLVLNPTGAIQTSSTNVLGWTGLGTLFASRNARGWGFLTGGLSAASFTAESVSFAFAGNSDMTFSADVYSSFLTGGSLKLEISFRSAADAELSTANVVINTAETRRRSVTATSPASCAGSRASA
jgi:hypothetical protein